MLDISAEKLAELKGKGFLFMKDKENFNVRLLIPAGITEADKVIKMCEIANKYGSGVVMPTVRLSLEIPGIKYEDIENVMKECDEAGIIYGGTGAKVRPVVTCKGSMCKWGLIDTQKIGMEIHDNYFPAPAPHKFKINVTGCPNNCAKVQFNDLGIMGAPNGMVKIFIGGRAGRSIVPGIEVGRIKAENVLKAVDICLEFYRAHGKAKERFCVTLDRVRDTEEYNSFIESLKALA
ncbi:MAG: hypothetical protein LUE88_01320 [Clostridiales bacterium]|nr:hypothetical protein [Clostridiales bacterium]